RQSAAVQYRPASNLINAHIASSFSSVNWGSTAPLGWIISHRVGKIGAVKSNDQQGADGPQDKCGTPQTAPPVHSRRHLITVRTMNAHTNPPNLQPPPPPAPGRRAHGGRGGGAVRAREAGNRVCPERRPLPAARPSTPVITSNAVTGS